MMLGTKVLWLPGTIRRWSLGSKSYRRLAGGMAGLMKRAEKVVRPRFKFITAPILQRVLGGFAFLLALLLLIPIPLGHLFPAFSLLVLGFGVMERDGLMAAGGVLCGFVSIGIIATVSGGILTLLAGL
jgi:hypothetical protein